MNGGIFIYILHSGISLAVFYIFYWLLLRKEKSFRFNRFYLLGAVVLSIVLPFFNFAGLFSSDIADSLPGAIVQNIILPAPQMQAVDTQIVTIPQSGFDPLDYLPYLYLLVAFLLLVDLTIGMIKLFLLYRSGKPAKFKGHIIVYTKADIAPFSFFNMIFINEEKIDKKSMVHIICHEYVHIGQRHSIDVLFMSIISCIMWFNPFVWLIKKSLKEVHEFQADEKVIAQGFDSVSYSELLINQIAGTKAMDFANCFNQLLIKKRLIMLKKLKPGRLASFKKLFIVPLALIMALSFNIKAQEKIEKVSKTAPKPHRTAAQQKAWADSIMNTDPNSIMDLFKRMSLYDTKAWLIAQKNVILPMKNVDTTNYSYFIAMEQAGNSYNVKVGRSKISLDQNGKMHLSKSEMVPFLNPEEVQKLMPIIPGDLLKKFQGKWGTSASSCRFESMTKNIEYWKTH